jgi:hypothetical protein
MNHAGEISTLVAIAEPDVRVWTNVGDAHLGFFESPDAIADAKAEILERARASTVLVCNADDPRVMDRARSRVKYCYEKELGSAPSLEGKVALSFLIGASGDVVSAQLAQNTLAAAEGARAGECIRRVVTQLKFPSPRGGGICGPLWNSMAAGAAAAGRDPKSLQAIVSPICALSKDGAAARACVRPLLAEGLQWFQPMTAAAGIDDATIEAARKAAQAGDMRRAAELVPEKALDFFTVCGTPRDVIPRLEGLVAAGANHLAFTVMPMLDVDETIRLIAREVMPHFGR